MKQRGKKKKELKEMRTTSETSGTMLNALTFESQVFQKKTKKKGHEKILEEIKQLKNSLKWRRKQPPKSRKPRESQTG